MIIPYYKAELRGFDATVNSFECHFVIELKCKKCGYIIESDDTFYNVPWDYYCDTCKSHQTFVKCGLKLVDGKPKMERFGIPVWQL